jgi:hypothetical protein
MNRIPVNIIKKNNDKFIKNATTPITEFPPFLPSMNMKKEFVDFVSNDGLLQKQSTAEDGYKNAYETLKSIAKDFGNHVGAFRVNINLIATIVPKEEAELEYNDDYVEKENTSEEAEEKPDKHECPECKAIIDAINSGKKMIGNINLANTAIESPYAVMETKSAKTEEISIYMDNYSFKLTSSANLTDNKYKISMLKVSSIEADRNSVEDTIEKIKDMLYPRTTDKYKHFILEYNADGLLNEIEIVCYGSVTPAEIKTLIETELRIAPVHTSGDNVLWIPVRYTKEPFLNSIRGKNSTSDIAENYIDTVVGNIRIKKDDRVNNREYVEHHNEIKWLDNVVFGENEITLYIK